MSEWPDIPTRLRRLKKSALNWDGRFYTMSDGTCCYSWSFLEAADLIEQQAARIAELEELIGNVSRGVQSCRVDINMAVVWLPAIQQINEYLRNKVEEEEDARAALNGENG